MCLLVCECMAFEGIGVLMPLLTLMFFESEWK